MNSRLHFFGYGRTMNPVFMKGICRHAKALCPATYQYHRLTERRFADIDPDPSSEVYGVLYSITPGDRKKLDQYAESLHVYADTEIEVKYGDETIRALTYVMTPEGKKECDGIPYEKAYTGECRRGAAHYMVPNSYRYANAIIYGVQIDDELDAQYLKNAVEIRPCTVTGTLYDSGYDYPLLSPDGNTVVEAQFIRVPRDVLEGNLETLQSLPFNSAFLVASLPDGNRVGGWTICLGEMPPRAKVIKSGCWEDRRKLKYDTLFFSISGAGSDAHLMIDFTDNTLYGTLKKLSRDEPEEEVTGMCTLNKYWRREIIAALDACHFERWRTINFSNGKSLPFWHVTLKKGEEDVKCMSGRNIFPLNWDDFKNVVRLCFRLIKSEMEDTDRSGKQETAADQEDESACRKGPDAPPGENADKPEKDSEAQEQRSIPETVTDDTAVTTTEAKKPAQETSSDLEPELPLFDTAPDARPDTPGSIPPDRG